MKYTLRENKITRDNPNDYIGVPYEVITHTRSDLILAITGPGSILKPTESNAVIDAYWKQIGKWIGKGEGYRDEYVSVRYSIGGVFITVDDRFDPGRHSINVLASLGQELLNQSLNIHMVYVKSDDIAPEVDHVYDWGSDTENTKLTPGGVLEIKGEHLKIYDNLEEEEGVFFISQSGGQETRATLIRQNQPQTLTLQVPALAAGNYRLEIRNTAYKTKTLRTGLTSQLFVVE